MQRITVDSSHLVAVGYDPAKEVLEVEFQEDQIYRYLDVPSDIYEGLLHADSYGQYFHAYIDKHYRYRKVEPGEESSQMLAFVTTNVQKFSFLKQACDEVGVAVEQLRLEVSEIQSDDPEKIALAKAKEAYRLVRRPVAVNDLFWNIIALRGFPGAYAKEVAVWFKPEDFLAVMADKKDRSVSRTETLVYYDGRRHKTFSYTTWCKITDEPRGKGPSLMQLVVPTGKDQTIAEIEEGDSPLGANDTVWHEFARWYKVQQKLGLA